MKIFHFGWEKHQWQEVVSQKLDSPSHFLNTDNCYGLYYITGTHFVYGQNTLLYIGMAQEQKFGHRLNQHDDFDITNIPKIEYLYVGRLIERDDGTPENWNSAIDISEKMLALLEFVWKDCLEWSYELRVT